MPEFTKEQRKVIEVRDRDVLVSAAAGSGKTTVLVERIIQMICDKDHPVDIDHLLVVTFTRAAAREMREKIRNAIEKKSHQQPENAHLLRQAAYVFHSQITTIDSFCNYIVKNYFYTLGIEPDFRILDSGEYTLLESEIIDEVLEEYYGQKSEALLRLSDAYSKGNSDKAVVEMILKLANEAMTNPWPKEWLDSLLLPYEVSSVEELSETEYVKDILSDAKKRIADCFDTFYELYQEDQSMGANTADSPALESDYQMFLNLKKAETFQEFYQVFSTLNFQTLARVQKTNPQIDFHEEFKRVRAFYKDELTSLKDYFEESLEEILLSLQNQKPYVETLVLLAKDYLDKRQTRLEKINAWNFSDIEHFALEILKDKTTKEATSVAIELRDFFAEIMVDEYQDSNYLQEEILRTITKEEGGRHNYFMVGDVKQSIYRFRQARPEIFSEKYEAFTLEDSLQQKIELDNNFRSRKQVLDTTNEIFLELMTPEIGNVAYDHRVSLKNGATYPNPDGKEFTTELLIGTKDKELLQESEIEDKSELEAVMIANRISELMKDFMVYDRNLDAQRKINYSDIVILLRASTNASTFVDVLSARGIPTYAEKSTGYFKATEVQTVLAFLRILDNPRQDIPLVTVMHSKMFDFTNEELAVIRSAYPKESFYKAVYLYYENHGDDKKLARFFELVQTLRQMVEDTPIHVLLQEIYERTGYLSYVYSLPSGESRRGNLYKLIDLAIKFETTSFKGLFRFCSYIDRLQKYETDMGEADLLSEDDDAVRIMTIHHSKGLEFPVVFLAEVSKKFNKKDAQGSMILHGSKGLALDEISLEMRTKKTPFLKKYISKSIINDSLGEEMRILYVALTRAKEKLIITGTYEEDKIPKALEESMTNSMRLNSIGYGGWMIPIMLKYSKHYDIRNFTPKELVELEVLHQVVESVQKEDFIQYASGANEEDLFLLQENINYSYPYEVTYPFKGKYSVSELKHRAMDLNEDADSEEVFTVTKDQSSEVNEKGVSVGALKGTAMHRFMECFDFSRLDEADILQRELFRVEEKKLMTKEDISLLDVSKLKVFLHSPLAGEMKNAALQKKLLKEQPFVMGDTPKHLLAPLYPNMDIKPDEDAPLVLVQGIIDAFYMKDEGIVLVDYKTDRISGEEELISRYKEQMDLYQKAIEKATHKKVIKRVLYSFSLGKEVVL